jgi:outer membrane biosynthesis protein TonB
MSRIPSVAPRRSARRALAATAAAAAAVLAIAGCGKDKNAPIPGGQAAYLVAQLDQVESRVATGDCVAVKRGTLKRIDKRVAALPDDVDPDVRSDVESAVDNLKGLVEDQCQPKPKPEPEPTQPQQTTPPETTPPETTPPETTPTQPEKPKEQKPKEKKPEEGSGGLPVPKGETGTGGAKKGKKG